MYIYVILVSSYDFIKKMIKRCTSFINIFKNYWIWEIHIIFGISSSICTNTNYFFLCFYNIEKWKKKQNKGDKSRWVWFKTEKHKEKMFGWAWLKWFLWLNSMHQFQLQVFFFYFPSVVNVFECSFFSAFPNFNLFNLERKKWNL